MLSTVTLLFLYSIQEWGWEWEINGKHTSYMLSTSYFLPHWVLSQTCEEGADIPHSMIVMTMEPIFMKHWSHVWHCASFYTYHPSCLISCLPEHCCHTESNIQFLCGFPSSSFLHYCHDMTTPSFLCCHSLQHPYLPSLGLALCFAPAVQMPRAPTSPPFSYMHHTNS